MSGPGPSSGCGSAAGPQDRGYRGGRRRLFERMTVHDRRSTNRFLRLPVFHGTGLALIYTVTFDGVAQLWFDSYEALNAGGATEREARSELHDDERQFIDLPRSPLFVGVEHEVGAQTGRYRRRRRRGP
ncbi:MAG: hypothetical protein HKN44_01725 [Ilumatobacter sp.]|nr:hypothetical protein [Ilumatobacter sp.]